MFLSAFKVTVLVVTKLFQLVIILLIFSLLSFCLSQRSERPFLNGVLRYPNGQYYYILYYYYYAIRQCWSLKLLHIVFILKYVTNPFWKHYCIFTSIYHSGCLMVDFQAWNTLKVHFVIYSRIFRFAEKSWNFKKSTSH